MATWVIALPVVTAFVTAIVVTLVIALANGRGRAIVSALFTVGLVVFCFIGTVVLVDSRPIRAVKTAILGQGESPLLSDPLVKLAKAGADESKPEDPTGGPEKPAAAPAEAEKKTEGDSSAATETTVAADFKSAEPPPDDNRPGWVNAKQPFKDGGVYKVPVTVGPWPTSEESMKFLPAAVDAEIAKYAVARAGHESAAKLKLPPDYVMGHMIEKDIWEESLKINSFDDVKHMVGRDVWENSANAADGKWTQLHVLVKFDRDVNQRLDDGWARLLRVERLQGFGALGGIVMIILAAVYSYLLVDLKTGGAYRGRLRAGALAAILALIALVLLNHA